LVAASQDSLHETIELRPLLARFDHGVANNDESAWQNLQMVAIATELLHAPFHVGIEGARTGEIVARGEDDFGSLGGELPSRFRRAGLNDNRPTLNGTRDVERSANPP